MEPAGAKNFTLLEHLPLGVFVLRPDGTVAEWNRCLEQWTGIPRADIVGRPIGDFSERLRRPQYQQRLEAVFQAGAPLILSSQLHGEIVPSVLPDGRPRIQQAMVTALPQSRSGDYWALFAIQDVTDLTHRIQAYREMRDEAFGAKKLAEQKAEDLKAAQGELEQFVYGASHDLKEPVRTLISFGALLANAMKFVPPGVRPQIEVTADKDSSQWTVGVQDNGIGIPEEYVGQIFQPFKRLHGVGEYEGSGVGLAICKKAIERHGGAIWVESQPGQGAHFRFTLPLAEENGR